jgi:hypothetical protein
MFCPKVSSKFDITVSSAPAYATGSVGPSS